VAPPTGAYATQGPFGLAEAAAPCRHCGHGDSHIRVPHEVAAQRSPDALNALWSGLSRAQRRAPDLLAAYAQRSAALGQPLAAMGELEAALRREWSGSLVRVYGSLPGDDANARLRTAENWLREHSDDADLLGALGRLCVNAGLWGKAREYLQRALELQSSAADWEALAESFRGSGDLVAATTCYANALQVARGAQATPLTGYAAPLRLEREPTVREERSPHGVPQLPPGSA